AAAVVSVRADLILDALHLFFKRAFEEFWRDDNAAFQFGLVLDPLPDLRARNLRGRGVLHQIVDRHRAAPAQPGLDVLHADTDVEAETLLGLGAVVNLQEVIAQHAHVLTHTAELVLFRQHALEY